MNITCNFINNVKVVLVLTLKIETFLRIRFYIYCIVYITIYTISQILPDFISIYFVVSLVIPHCLHVFLAEKHFSNIGTKVVDNRVYQL